MSDDEVERGGGTQLKLLCGENEKHKRNPMTKGGGRAAALGRGEKV